MNFVYANKYKVISITCNCCRSDYEPCIGLYMILKLRGVTMSNASITYSGLKRQQNRHRMLKTLLDLLSRWVVISHNNVKDVCKFSVILNIGIACSYLLLNSLQQAQLKNLYKAGLTAAEQEERLLRAALTRIYEIRAIKNERRMQVFIWFGDPVEVYCIELFWSCNARKIFSLRLY